MSIGDASKTIRMEMGLKKHISVWLIRLTGLDSLHKQENMLLLVCSESTEFEPVKLVNSCPVTLIIVIAFCLDPFNLKSMKDSN